MATQSEKPVCCWILAKKIHGGLQLITDRSKGRKPIRVRLQFGESAAEAMADVDDTVRNATKDHAMRDFIVSLSWLGKPEVGNTGFRFVRIDLVDDNAELKLKVFNGNFIVISPIGFYSV